MIGDQIRINRPAHKYRLTVEVETPEGRKSASGVMAVHPDRSYTRRGQTRTLGDAVYVDLGQGKNLVALLAHVDSNLVLDDVNYIALRAYAEASGKHVPFSQMSQLTGIVPVKGAQTPVLVSLRRPGRARDRAGGNARGYGSGAWKRLSGCGGLGGNGAQRVWPLDFGGALGEPVTRDIQARLPWLGGPAIRRPGPEGGRPARGRRD